MNQNYDVIIIGGGIIGCSVAAHLASENLKIAVVNSKNLGTPASIAAAGLLTPFQLHEQESPLIKDFCFKSFEYFSKFYETIHSYSKIDLGFKQVGSLYLIFSNLEIAKKEGELKELRKIDPKISFLNKQEISKYELLITKDILGAYHYPNEGFINNPKFLNAILSYCLNKKVRFLNTEANNINITKFKIEDVELATGEKISAKKYVLSNGIWANKIIKKIFNTNETIIKAIKGEVLQVEAWHGTPLQKIIFCKDGYILHRPPTNQFEKPTILIGSTSEEVNIEEGMDVFNNTISGISFLTNLLQQLLPSYKNSAIINQWAGLRPQTRDNLPILGQCIETENLYYALGHYRNGILMGPLTGKILKSLILEETLEDLFDYKIEAFKIDRLFKQSQTVENKLSVKI